MDHIESATNNNATAEEAAGHSVSLPPPSPDTGSSNQPRYVLSLPGRSQRPSIRVLRLPSTPAISVARPQNNALADRQNVAEIETRRRSSSDPQRAQHLAKMGLT
ncbi:hypothetical protein ACJ72_01502 [Emergomyces africanus]|uniref:Uncharacterized protein n=1 Tax=Emergomyces africanus TaxID=1955775 RepID=A0A1B7P537_9EURO|nr:hypothetical protein ACJ72_01502 [Emergomyces africanus]